MFGCQVTGHIAVDPELFFHTQYLQAKAGLVEMVAGGRFAQVVATPQRLLAVIRRQEANESRVPQ